MDRNTLIENHMDLVRKAAYRFYKYVSPNHRGMVGVDDLISAGYVGLAEAADNFKEDGGASFSTYAYYWINEAIQAELRFYCVKDALLIDDESWEKITDEKKDTENEDPDDASVLELPENKKTVIIKRKLKELGLTPDELRVYLEVKGIGCKKVTNLKSLARELGKKEMDVRRLKQSAERKIRKEISDV